MKQASWIVLRIGIAAVIIWFGVQQFANPSSWFGFLPAWTSGLPISQTAIVYLNGWFEIIFGLLLLFGMYTRVVAGLIALHLLDITITVGYNAIGVRDFGLFIATLSLFLQGATPLSLDLFFSNRKSALAIK